MKYVMIENGGIYTVSNELAKRIEVAFTLADTIDGDMSDIIDLVKRYGKFVGEVFITIRN